MADEQKAIAGRLGRCALRCTALGIIVQCFVASEAPAAAFEMIGATPTGFVTFSKNVSIRDLPPKEDISFSRSCSFDLLGVQREFSRIPVLRFSGADHPALLDFHFYSCYHGWPASSPEVSHDMQFVDCGRCFAVVLQTKTDFGFFAVHGVDSDFRSNFHAKEHIGSFNPRNMFGGFSGGISGAASGDCCATCSNLGESQKANLNERNANENGGEERKNRSIESDRIVRGPVPPGAKYVVGLIFIAGLIGTVMMGWLMGVFRSSPNFVDEE